jgi:hypothetical protein
MTGPLNPGIVDWSGENPGIYLKDTQDGPWLSLAVFFRVVTSDYGRGVGIVCLGSPAVDKGFPAVDNFCVTDNPALMRYLVTNFCSKFGSFRGQAGLGAMTWLPMLSHHTSGDARRHYSESMTAPGVSVSLVWEDLQAPIAADVPPNMGPTQAHQMYSVFQEAKGGSIIVNGKSLAGRVWPRDFLGRKMSTAFLAFSETWVKPRA